MMKSNIRVAVFVLSSAMIVVGCSSVGGLFKDKNTPDPLEGERISVLDFEKKLIPDLGLADGQAFALPEQWTNPTWPQAGGYPNHSMQNLALSSDPLNKAWSTNIGAGGSGDVPLTAQPIVVGDVIYAVDAKSKLSAFDVKKGKRVWRRDVRDKDEDEVVIGGGISFADGTIYVTNGSDQLLAVSPNDGEVLWRKDIAAPSRAAPTVIAGRVFISTIDNRLISLNAKNGTSLWEYTGIAEVSGLLGGVSAGANNTVVVPAFSSGEVTALRIENGAVSWSDNLSGVRHYGGGLESLSDIKAMPVLDRGLVIAMSYGGKITAIDERTGTRVWQRDIGGTQTPWVADNLLFVVTSDNQLITMNAISGELFWVTQLAQFKDEEDKEGPIRWVGPVLAGGRLIVASSHGYIHEIDAHTGHVTNTIKVKKPFSIPPVVSNNALYLLADDGTLLAFK